VYKRAVAVTVLSVTTTCAGLAIFSAAAHATEQYSSVPPRWVCSAVTQEAVQHALAELQAVVRHPLVPAVEERGEVQVGWQA
jgi:hypothetical protein